MTKINNRRRNHNATLTQRISWLIFRNGPTRFTQRKKVFEYLKNRTANSRQLSNDLKIERASVTRTLKDLEDAGLVNIAYEAKCPVTGILTQFYEITTQEEVKAPTWSQGDLFGIIDTIPPAL